MRRAFAVVIALSSLGCGLTGPSDDISGTWIAQGAGHTLLFGLTLHQSGDSITGTACAKDGGMLLYSGAVVTGDYPHLQFTVAPGNTQPCCATTAGARFDGKQDRTLDIVGRYANGDLRFKRSETNLCN